MAKEETTRKLTKRLKDAGFVAVRTTGSHTTYVNGKVSVTVPDGHRIISAGIVRQVNKAIEETQQ
ncbi:type II toxin-antitoxin system HicA family toxin [Leifsonia sp. F6_8S_P_1B]|uniref:Type II toxin-antitoxin system HicA family toxin n=1 Tax=Leifsonia williamsii TaxID=3035919 RepID=A0ABT8KHA6_9MICO|nr:type II toxin-antitoxin system HicA family toxin [Leifsonia williamsii]MDN4616387.1 type II toxin-antitoxin system HicA family toxin [Leifsonia williamsii]